mmetsp:Transcript_22002/g.46409  ORF Transcript_22002/g.46409 Transcript_22002/m.46409 type:complete len:311 (-) Transcript_22002:663-1595(-)
MVDEFSQQQQQRAYTDKLEEKVLALSMQLMQVQDAGEELSPEYVAASQERLNAMQEELRKRREEELRTTAGPSLPGANSSRRDAVSRNESVRVDDDDSNSIFAMAKRMDKSKILDEPSCIEGANDDEYWKKRHRGKKDNKGSSGTATAARSSNTAKQRETREKRDATRKMSQTNGVGRSRNHSSQEMQRDRVQQQKLQRERRDDNQSLPKTSKVHGRHDRKPGRQKMSGSGAAIRLHQKVNGNQTSGSGSKSGKTSGSSSKPGISRKQTNGSNSSSGNSNKKRNNDQVLTPSEQRKLAHENRNQSKRTGK